MAHKILSPLFVMLPRKTKADKKLMLNLNVYRNTHYQTLNNAKVVYKELMEPQVSLMPYFERIEVSFTLYPKTKRRTDLGNVCSIHEKFFMDSLVELGKLPDDDYTHHVMTVYELGEVDKAYPRVEILIREV